MSFHVRNCIFMLNNVFVIYLFEIDRINSEFSKHRFDVWHAGYFLVKKQIFLLSQDFQIFIPFTTHRNHCTKPGTIMQE